MPSSIEEAFNEWTVAWRKEALAIAVASIALPCAITQQSRTMSEEALIEALDRIPK
jgi:hypothetical protein